jgi:hypothetical protein
MLVAKGWLAASVGRENERRTQLAIKDASSLAATNIPEPVLPPTPVRSPAFSVWTEFTMVTVRGSVHPSAMSLVTRLFTSSEQACEPMASSTVNFRRKTRTVHWWWCDCPVTVHRLQR